MKILVKRGTDDGLSIPGQLFVDGIFECYTLEPSASAQYPCVPAGTFLVALLESPRFGMVTPHIQNVPGRTFIEIHPGNAPKDTEGCLLVGETQTADWVGSSRYAFLKLMALLEQDPTNNLTITYLPAQ